MRQRVSLKKRSFAQGLRKASTDAERALWRLLRSRRFAGAKFRRQVPIGPWIGDFVSFEHRLIVEVDGSQHIDNRIDPLRDADLMRRGFRVERFWNNDVLACTKSVMERLLDILHPPHPVSRLTARNHPLPQGEREGDRNG